MVHFYPVDGRKHYGPAWTNEPQRFIVDPIHRMPALNRSQCGQYDEARAGVLTHGLFIRQNIADTDIAFFPTWCHAGTTMKTLVEIEGHRWTIEASFETAKNELGLDHNETRSWHGWHRHISLIMLTLAMTAAIRHQANTSASKKTT